MSSSRKSAHKDENVKSNNKDVSKQKDTNGFDANEIQNTLKNIDMRQVQELINNVNVNDIQEALNNIDLKQLIMLINTLNSVSRKK